MKTTTGIELIGGIHGTPSVAEQPELVLEVWRVLLIEGVGEGPTRHFVGWNVSDREGRVSSPILDFDPTTMRGRTRSGRVYELRGRPGHDCDADYVLHRWMNINRITRVDDVTKEYLPAEESPLAKKKATKKTRR